MGSKTRDVAMAETMDEILADPVKNVKHGAGLLGQGCANSLQPTLRNKALSRGTTITRNGTTSQQGHGVRGTHPQGPWSRGKAWVIGIWRDDKPRASQSLDIVEGLQVGRS